MLFRSDFQRSLIILEIMERLIILSGLRAPVNKKPGLGARVGRLAPTLSAKNAEKGGASEL
jgi:hypothetical protein